MNTRAPGRHFLQIPGPTDVPGRVLRAISEPTTDHRGPDFADARTFGPDRPQAGLPDERPRGDLSRLRHGRVGSGARQYALAGRRGHHAANRLVRHALERNGEAPRARADPPGDRLATRRRPCRDRESAPSRQGRENPRGLRRPQRDLDRLRQPCSLPCAEQSTRPDIRRCCLSTRSLRLLRSSIGTRSGASTSPSPEARRG